MDAYNFYTTFSRTRVSSGYVQKEKDIWPFFVILRIAYPGMFESNIKIIIFNWFKLFYSQNIIAFSDRDE